MSRVLPSSKPSRLSRLQEAEQRRQEIEEAKRQEAEARSEKRIEAERLARESREADKMEREAKVMERLASLTARWDRADKKVASVKLQVKKAAAERVAAWQKRRRYAMARLHPETLFERMRRWAEEEFEEPEVKETKTKPRKQKAWKRPLSAQVLPRGPPAILLEPRAAANAARAMYDGREDDGINMRRLEEAQKAAEHAQRRNLLAIREECVLAFRKMLRVRRLGSGWPSHCLRRMIGWPK